MSSLPWYIARSAGLTAWALLAAAVLWGLAVSTGFLRSRPRAAWLLDLHRYLSGLAVIFVVVHVAGILIDSYVHISALAAVVPFASSWRPVAVAWGVVVGYLLIAVELTSLARAHLPARLWRATHVASFPLFLLATVHALTAGTDAHTWVFELSAAVVTLAITTLAAYRIAGETTRPTGPAGARAKERIA